MKNVTCSKLLSIPTGVGVVPRRYFLDSIKSIVPEFPSIYFGNIQLEVPFAQNFPRGSDLLESSDWFKGHFSSPRAAESVRVQQVSLVYPGTDRLEAMRRLAAWMFKLIQPLWFNGRHECKWKSLNIRVTSLSVQAKLYIAVIVASIIIIATRVIWSRWRLAVTAAGAFMAVCGWGCRGLGEIFHRLKVTAGTAINSAKLPPCSTSVSFSYNPGPRNTGPETT